MKKCAFSPLEELEASKKLLSEFPVTRRTEGIDLVRAYHTLIRAYVRTNLQTKVVSGDNHHG